MFSIAAVIVFNWISHGRSIFLWRRHCLSWLIFFGFLLIILGPTIDQCVAIVATYHKFYVFEFYRFPVGYWWACKCGSDDPLIIIMVLACLKIVVKIGTLWGLLNQGISMLWSSAFNIGSSNGSDLFYCTGSLLLPHSNQTHWTYGNLR